MRNSTRFLFAACLVAAMPVAASAAPKHSWMSAAALARANSGSGALVFASDFTNNVVNIYSAGNPSQPVGQIAGLLSQPGSLAVDTSGNLFVYNARTNSILEFVPPYTGVPVKSYYDGLTGISSLTVDAAGTIYSANNYEIVEYPRGDPRARLVNLPVIPTGVTLDPRGRPVSAFNGGGGAGVLRMLGGSPVPENLQVTLESSPTDVLYDASGNLVVQDNAGAYISIFKPGAKKPSATWTANLVAPTHMALSADGTTLYVSDQGDESVKAFSYPAGQELWQITGFANIGGVAVSPGAIPGGRRNVFAPFPAIERAALNRPIPPRITMRNHIISLASNGGVHEFAPWMRLDATRRRVKAGSDAVWVGPIGYPAPVEQYALPNNNNGAPDCSTADFSAVNNIAADGSGNLWVPAGNNGPLTGTVQEAFCGGSVGTPINDAIGQPADVAFDSSGNRIVGDIVDYYPDNGGWYLEAGTASSYDANGTVLGTLSDTSFFSIHPPGFDIFNLLDAIANDAHGNCYISHEANTGGGEVVEFPGCTPAKHGKVLKGPHPWSAGKVTFDAAGNMIVTDFAAIYYYRQWYASIYAPPYDGKPTKTFQMYGPAVSCGLDSAQAYLYCANTWNGTVDAYTYPGGVYTYSFNNGLQTYGSSGLAVVPSGSR